MEQIALTADDVKAIKQATGFSVRLNSDGGTVLHCYKTVKVRREDEVFNANNNPTMGSNQRKRDIVVETYNEYGTSGWFSALYPNGQWKLLGQIVKAGDTLEFRAMENGNGYTRAAVIPAGKLPYGDRSAYDALFVDQLSLTIYRTDKKGRRHAVVHDWLMGYSICPDNTGRAIRPYVRKSRQVEA